MSSQQYKEAYDAYALHGSYTKAGEALGIDRATVKNRIKKYYSDPNESLLHKSCDETRTPVDDVSCYWVKTDGVSMLVRRSNEFDYEQVRDKLIEEMKNHVPSYEKLEYTLGSNLLIIDPADVHVGKLSRSYETGEEYNIQTAVNRMNEGVNGLIEKAKPFGVKKVIFVVGNDILHIDRPNRTTTGGTAQDTDGQWWEMFLAAKKAYVAAIERASTLAPVHVIFCPSNHDFASGWMLADTLSSWFRENPNVTFGDDQRSVSISHRKYVVFGNNLIGFTHGDGAKESDLQQLMQYEARAAWGNTKYSYMYTHHFHHKSRKTYGLNANKLEKDHTGITTIDSGLDINPENNVYVETIRSPSPADAWHDRNGYKNRQAIEAFLHDPEVGQIARFTQFF